MFFSGGARLDGRTVSHHTVVLLISQSGQTFPTLHATRLMVNLLRENVFMLVGGTNTKMEQTMKQVRVKAPLCHSLEADRSAAIAMAPRPSHAHDT